MTDPALPTLTNLRDQHQRLLKVERESGLTPELGEAIESFLKSGTAIGAYLDEDQDRDAAQSWLDYWVTRLFRLGRPESEASLANFDPALAPTLPDELCPYVGLYPFNEQDSSRFFGRVALVNRLLKHLKTNNLLAVVGPSGSGKSSVVRAGLIPALKAGRIDGSTTWHFLDSTVPGSRPLVNLFTRLHKLGPALGQAAPEWAEHQAQACLTDPAHLTMLLAQFNLARAVLVIDQFEEIFSLAPDNDRAAFVAALLQTLAADHIVIITLRADFTDKVNVLTEFYKLFRTARVDVEAMDAGEIREAIEGPAHRIGLKLEAGLTDKLLSDVLGKPAALPLLQFTLLRLWNERDHNRLTLAAYRQIGGGRALAQAADEFFADLKTLEDQAAAKWLFLQLVQPAPDSLEFTSRRVRRDSLFENAPARDRVERVLQALIAVRLVRESVGDAGADVQIEVAHEALIRNWERLVNWLEDEREHLRERRRVEADAADWALAHAEARLYRGVRLEEVVRQLRSTPTLFSPQVHEFLEASQQLAEVEQAAREAARQTERDLANARVLATETEARRQAEANGRRMATWLGLVALGAALIAIFFSFQSTRNAELAATNEMKAETNAAVAEANAQTAEIARTEAVGQATKSAGLAATAESLRLTAEADRNIAASAQVEAETERDNAATAQANAQAALSRQLAAQAKELLSDDYRLALLLGVEASNIFETTEATTLLQTAIESGLSRTIEPLPGRPIPAQTGVVFDLAFSPDGSHLAWAGPGSAVNLWDLTTQELTGLSGQQDFVKAVAFSAKGDLLASGDDSGVVFIWDVAQRRLLDRLNAGTGSRILCLAFDPQSNRLAVGHANGEITLWNVAEQRVLFTIRAHSKDVRGLAWSPDGRYIASGSLDETLRVWQADTGAAYLTPARNHNGSVWGVEWSNDGKWIVTSGGLDRRLVIWNATDGSVLGRTDTEHTSDVIGLALNRDHSLAISSSNDRSIYLWAINDPQKIEPLFQIESGGGSLLATVVAFSPVENIIAYTSNFSVQLRRITLPPASDQPLTIQACQLAGRNLSQTEWTLFFPGQDYHLTCDQFPAGQ